MNRGAEYCPAGNCPTISATAESENMVVQGAVTDDPGRVEIPRRIGSYLELASDLVMPGYDRKDGIAVRSAQQGEGLVTVEGIPLQPPETGSVPRGEGLVLVKKIDMAELFGIPMPKLPRNPRRPKVSLMKSPSRPQLVPRAGA